MPGPRFLTSFAKTIATMTLYREGHPARERAIDQSYTQLRRLQEHQPRVLVTFLGEEVVCGGEPIRQLRDWEWSARLAAAGIQRLEFDEGVTRDEFEEFLEEIIARLSAALAGTAEARQMRPSRIRFGAVGVKDESAPDEQVTPLETFEYSFDEEADTLRWLHDQVQQHQELHLAEAEAVVRSLSLAMHGDRQMLIPLLQLRHFDEYTTTHAMNVSVLAMALSEHVGLGARDVRAFGVAGLLHDIGKVNIPAEILTKPGKLTAAERGIMNSHTVEGARIILQTQEQLDLAAVVAYEHHIMLDGGGYPSMKYRRDCHYASKIVHVCDVYDALRTNRPYRDAWSSERVLGYMEEKAGSEFDPHIAHAFAEMMRKWEPRVARITESGELVGHESAPLASDHGSAYDGAPTAVPRSS